MATTPKYGWPLPDGEAIQIAKINKIADALSAIDGTFSAFEQAYNTHTHAFADLTGKPNSLAGYGIEDGVTDAEFIETVQSVLDDLRGGVSPELDTLKKIATAINNNPEFHVTLNTALDGRVSVLGTQAFTLAQKAQARTNIDALGTGDKGRAGGVAPLGTDNKVPADYLPTLTTKETMYSALLSAVYDDAVDNADSRFPWMDLATGVFKRATWSGLVNRMTTAVKATFYTKAEVNSIVAGNMAGRAYPRRSDGAGITLNWSGQGGQPSWIWGGNDGYNMFVYNPANFNVASVGGWTAQAIINQIESRAAAFADDRKNGCVIDTRFAGYVSNIMAKDTTWSAPSGYVFTAAGRNSGDQYTFYARQLQVYIPYQGWRAFGAF
ncbi:hypothetical protein [Brucella anthropi]|uniref:hypothetical protein n=1 Tax=Brucella anthropi TaxID=529 RepID=UPI000F65E9B7|nr:hypothetical protein [Brucella anthropi]RRY08798.1 hypothetical protein EGJ58_12925 [Brucella anthropi]